MGERRVAFVTGGAKRVGRAIVEMLVREGFDVLFTYRGSKDEANELVAQSAGRAHAEQVDLSEPAESLKKAQEALTRFDGRLDLLVNNASMYVPDAQLDAAGRQKLFAANVESPILLAEAFADRLRATSGLVINMIDLMAERPWPRYAAYCASKAALLNATLSLARQLAPSARANGISPGVVEWPEDMPQSERDKYLQKVPLRRAGTPADVASLVRYLALEGTYITGQIIRLDGGRSLL